MMSKWDVLCPSADQLCERTSLIPLSLPLWPPLCPPFAKCVIILSMCCSLQKKLLGVCSGTGGDAGTPPSNHSPLHSFAHSPPDKPSTSHWLLQVLTHAFIYIYTYINMYHYSCTMHIRYALKKKREKYKFNVMGSPPMLKYIHICISESEIVVGWWWKAWIWLGSGAIVKGSYLPNLLQLSLVWRPFVFLLVVLIVFVNKKQKKCQSEQERRAWPTFDLCLHNVNWLHLKYTTLSHLSLDVFELLWI